MYFQVSTGLPFLLHNITITGKISPVTTFVFSSFSFNDHKVLSKPKKMVLAKTTRINAQYSL